MGSNGKAIGQWWPSEKASRRVGWTEGPGIVLLNGETWHFPKVGDSLIPVIRPIAVMAVPTKQVTTAILHEKRFDDEVVHGFNEFFGEFVCDVLETQYTCPPQTLSDLAYGRAADHKKIGEARMMTIVDGYIDELFAYIRRMPVAWDQEAFRELAGLN